MRKLTLVGLTTCLLLQTVGVSAKQGNVFSAPYTGATIGDNGDVDPAQGTVSVSATAHSRGTTSELSGGSSDAGAQQHLFHTFDHHGPTRDVTVTVDMSILSAAANTGSGMGDDGSASAWINLSVQHGFADRIRYAQCCSGEYVYLDYFDLIDTHETTPEPASIQDGHVAIDILLPQLARGTYTVMIGLVGSASYDYDPLDTETGSGAPGTTQVEVDAILDSITVSK